MAQDDVEVREACFADYQAVMDISHDIYNGRDYLPKMYHVFLHDKNSNCFVILLNGRIVSILSSLSAVSLAKSLFVSFGEITVASFHNIQCLHFQVGYQNNYIVDSGTRYIKQGFRIAEDCRVKFRHSKNPLTGDYLQFPFCTF